MNMFITAMESCHDKSLHSGLICIDTGAEFRYSLLYEAGRWQMSDWISVKDRLPENNVPVDIWCAWKQGNPTRETDVQRVWDSIGLFWQSSMGHIDDSVVTHWMLRPAPPEPEVAQERRA